ncbi:hypothetical protein V6N11_067915 [Hibiscus sabdariffa]|uniref:Uncharacterized protein n=1 Tax=Hibiscus sabdariffa TaxID=183260 RepID=A0ABR2SSW6_9ROSI
MANNTISLRSLLEKEKLNGINFLDWFRNLRIVLKQERKEYVIEEAVPNDPGPNASRADKDKFKKHMDDMVDVGCLMLATMTPELQKQHENMVAFEMIQNLKEIYEGQARQERYETSKALFQCKMSEGSSLGAHVIKMMGYIQTLEKLGFALNDELATDVILQSLPDSFNQFVLNFNMNEINKTLPQLLGMLRTAESNMKKGGSKSVLMVRVAKEKGKKVAKSKGSGKTKPKGKEALKPKGGVSKDGKCFHCGKTGHWKRNCPIYLEDVKKAKAVGASVSGIYVIDVHVSTSSSWVLDTGCGSHICTSVQGLHTRRNLAKGDVDLRVGNGARVAALAARGGYQYFITFTDDFSRYGYIYLMRHKSEALEKFKEFKNELTPPGTPQRNGVSERRNRTLMDMVRSMMSHTDLPTSFWGYALETAAFTLNRVPSKSVQKTPHEMWTGRRPNMSFMKIWGCKAYVKHQMSTKLEPKSEKCTFVGYPKETKGYYFYNENKVFVARTGVFLEKEFLTNSGEETQPLRRSTRERHEPERYGFLVTTHGDVILVDQDEPKTYQEAVASPDSEKWLEAMRSEMDSMSENQVWTLVEPPEGIKPIGCKWVFKKKTDMDGNVQTYKGRLVAKGFRQIHGVNYDETFSPVAMIKSIRILLAVAAFHDYEIWQMDVKTAFLNGKLEEDVYMTQPEGFVTPEDARKVCKLQRSIYGLKQVSRSWNLRFNEAIQEFGFIRNEDEPCVYKKFSGSIVSFLVLYVDDILIIGNDIPTLQSIKTWLSSCFSMKDLGEAAYILGVKIYRDRSRRLLDLSQSTYIDKVLKRFSMEESKRGFLPMRHGISLSKEMCPSTPQERERMSQIPYASAIGSIMYAMICTRPDLSYALSMTSKYQANPGEGHWTIVKNILKYLRRTKDVFLVYGGEEELRIKGYTDASFQTDKDDSRSQSGFVFCLNGGAVSWKSSKQDTVADSTTEAEYIAASEAAKEAVWIKKFITELGVIPSISDAVDLYCDNNGAIAEAKEPRSHQRSKHILRRFHLIREIIDRGDVEICKVNTDDNIADPLTKPLAQQKHDRHTESLGIRYAATTCPAGGLLIPLAQQNNQQQPARTVRDYLAEDLDGLHLAVSIPEIEAEHFELKPVMFNMLNTLGQFGGSPAKNARQHLKSFLEICNSFKIHGVSNDVLKLKLFPYSLKDKANDWLNNLPSGSFQSWTKLC